VLRKGKLQRDDVVLTTRGTLGNTAYYSKEILYENIRINSGMVLLRSNTKKVLPLYLLQFLNSNEFTQQINKFMSGSAQPQLPINILSQITFPLPPLDLQKKLIAQIEEERRLVDTNKKLGEIYKDKIKSIIDDVWNT
jgi:restriction endonuclease S subunit